LSPPTSVLHNGNIPANFAAMRTLADDEMARTDLIKNHVDLDRDQQRPDRPRLH